MFKLPELPYSYEALEPRIDATTMKIHHTKHHAGYVDKLNKALEGHADLQRRELEELLVNLPAIPESIRSAVRNNGGGHANHTLFWTSMSPDGGGEPTGELAERMVKEFDSFESFRTQFTRAATGRFGSGWAWLMVDEDKLAIGSTANQDSPLMEGKVPLLGLDVWEHAYYLNYQNRRADYVDAWWHLVDWTQVSERFETALTAVAVS